MPTDPDEPMPGIGTLNEKPLHAALKAWYAEPGDRFEVAVDGFHVDIVRGDLLVEIQTAGVSALRYKLAALARQHRVRLVLPVATEKWIVRVGDDGQTPVSRRRSPKHGRVETLFAELVRIPHVLGHANFSVEALLIREEEVRRQEPGRAWRRKGWVTHERRLLEVVGRRRLDTLADLADLLPDGLPEPFTTADIAAALAAPRRLAQQMACCLRETGVLAPAGKRGNAILYSPSSPAERACGGPTDSR